MSTWAIAKVTDSTPETLEYGAYRGYVLLRDDAWEQNLGTVNEGLAAFAERVGADPVKVHTTHFVHDQYEWYRVLETS